MSIASSVLRAGVDQLPFNSALKPEVALAVLRASMDVGEYGKSEESFTHEYEKWYRALRMVKKRYIFYHEALFAPDLYSKIGQRTRIERLTLAIHNCIVEGKRIEATLRAMPDAYLSKCLNAIRCRLFGINPCPSKSIGMGFVPSSCVLTHICTCAGLGDMPPYMYGCSGLSDMTLLISHEEPIRKRVFGAILSE
jgi:hypothetical protein